MYSILSICLILLLIITIKQHKTINLIRKLQQKPKEQFINIEKKLLFITNHLNQIEFNKIKDTNSSDKKYEELIKLIPLYTRKFIAAIITVIFTVTMLYMFNFIAISYTSALYAELKIPYFEYSTKLDLWNFYVFHLDILLLVIFSISIFITFYVIGWIGILNPNKFNKIDKIIYLTLIAIVVFAYCLVAKKYNWQIYTISIFVFVICMFIAFHFEQKREQKTTSKDNHITENISKKLLIYIVVAISTMAWLSFLIIGTIAFTGYFANEAGKDAGIKVLESINNNQFIKTPKYAVIKSSGEEIYAIDCDFSNCLIIKKHDNHKLLFESIDRKQLIFLNNNQ